MLMLLSAVTGFAFYAPVGLLAAYSDGALGSSKRTVEKPDTVVHVLSSVGILAAVYALLLILLRS